MALTDSPPTNVSILSAEVTLTGATLNPGNVPLLASPATLELTRLQTDFAYLSTTSVDAGSYTSLALTFANPSLTIENDTASPIVSGTTTCPVGAICTFAPISANLSTTITLPTLIISANTGAGLLLDVKLDDLLSSTLGADFKSGTTVSQFTFTPAISGPLLVAAEDVVGQVTSMDTVHNTFSFQNATRLFSLTVDNTTTFLQFPPSLCTTSVFTCLRDGQILSVDIGIRSDGIAVARNVLFEDGDSSDTEVEGIITGTNAGLQQFTIVTLAESATISGLNIGDTATVQYTPVTPFNLDFTHADNAQVDTSCCIFGAPTDLSVGQQVSVRRNSISSGNLINADRVRLRSSRITATVQTIGAPSIFLYNLPSLFSGHSITQIQAQTSAQTILSENGVAIIFTQIPISSVVSVRGPLFNVSGARTLVATKVIVKP
ncbi:MAG: hypothetical protein LAN18_09425 [Acidobacteriia bacterium]|nr:hypothetical protein [Terriglobia bacterium]